MPGFFSELHRGCVLKIRDVPLLPDAVVVQSLLPYFAWSCAFRFAVPSRMCTNLLCMLSFYASLVALTTLSTWTWRRCSVALACCCARSYSDIRSERCHINLLSPFPCFASKKERLSISAQLYSASAIFISSPLETRFKHWLQKHHRLYWRFLFRVQINLPINTWVLLTHAWADELLGPEKGKRGRHCSGQLIDAALQVSEKCSFIHLLHSNWTR